MAFGRPDEQQDEIFWLNQLKPVLKFGCRQMIDKNTFTVELSRILMPLYSLVYSGQEH